MQSSTSEIMDPYSVPSLVMYDGEEVLEHQADVE